MIIDLDRVEKYISLGFDKEDAVKRVEAEAKAEAKADLKQQQQTQTPSDQGDSKEQIDALINEIESLKTQIQNQALQGAQSGVNNTQESADDVMNRIFGGSNEH